MKIGNQEITIIGKVVNMQVREGESKNSGIPYISLTTTIRSNQHYHGCDHVTDTIVNSFAMKYRVDAQGLKTLDSSYENLKNAATFKTIEHDGVNEASVVRVKSRARIRERYYVDPRTGTMRENWEINSPYINLVTTNAEETASFRLDAFIIEMKEEIDASGDETGRLIVKAGLPQWGDKLDVVDLIAERPEDAAMISRTWEDKQTIDVWGYFNFGSKEVKQVEEELSWGEKPKMANTTRAVREMIISYGELKEDDLAFDPVEVRKAYNVRKADREQKLLDAKSGNTAVAPATAAPKKVSHDWEE